MPAAWYEVVCACGRERYRAASAALAALRRHDARCPVARDGAGPMLDAGLVRVYIDDDGAVARVGRRPTGALKRAIEAER